MADPRTRIMRLLSAAQAQLLRQENGVIRQIHAAYEQARKEILGEITDAYQKLGDDPSPATIRRLAGDRTLVLAIERRMRQLELEFGGALRDGLTAVTDLARDDVLAQLQIMAEGLDIEFFRFAIDDLMELTVIPAVEQVPAMTAPVMHNLILELRTGLARGDRFRDIAKRLLSRDDSIFSRGLTSAELMARRAIIQANNNARLMYMDKARQQIPGMKKQAVAAIQSRTTKTCLRVHGQIQPVDKPFELKAIPRFARKLMSPPFHWNCRTSVVPYHKRFERTSGLKTADMKAAARAELANR